MTITLPIRTVSEANTRGHWRPKAERVKQHRGLASALCRDFRFHRAAVVTLTRVVGPRGKMLDSDNITISLKSCRDGIADALAANGCIRQVKQGKHRLAGDDSDPRVEWRYQQRRGFEYAVEVEITERSAT